MEKKMSNEFKTSQEMCKTCESKKDSSWVLKFPEEFNIPTYVIKSIPRPELNIPISEVNGVKFCSGKASWENMEIIMYDPICPSTSQAIYNNIIVPNKFTDFIIIVETLCPTGEVCESWEIDVETILGINFGTQALCSSSLNYQMTHIRNYNVY
jgi:hypothetical protein